MQNKTLTFQLPTHFLSRTALRIECLLDNIHQASESSHTGIHRYNVKNILEIIELIEKPELKSRFLKELIRIEYVLTKANITMSDHCVERLSNLIQFLNQVPGKFGADIHEIVFLKSVRQIHQPNSKDCEFNSPQLLMWLDLPAKQRQKELQIWLECLSDLQETIQLYLSLLRSISCTSTITAHRGYYHHSLSPKITCHLIQITMDKTRNLVPKLQVGQHGLSIRLYDFNSLKEIKEDSVDLDISICQL